MAHSRRGNDTPQTWPDALSRFPPLPGLTLIRRARVLLALDTSVGVVDEKKVIAARLGVSGETVRLVAKLSVVT